MQEIHTNHIKENTVNYNDLIVNKARNTQWLFLISTIFVISYFVIIALYVIHSKEYPVLLTVFIVLTAIFILIPFAFFFRYNYLSKKILGIEFKEINHFYFNKVKKAQIEIIIWTIISNITCFSLFVISNFLSVKVSHFQNYFTMGFLLVFFFSSIFVWVVIILNCRKNSTLFSVIIQFFISTFENKPDLIKNPNNFTILCQYNGFKYEFLEKVLNGTYWVSNFMWIYIISALIGTAFATDGPVESLISVIDLLSYFGPYFFLFYVRSMMVKEKDTLSGFKLLRIINDTKINNIYIWLVNIQKHFSEHSVYYKRNNTFYWCMRTYNQNVYINNYYLYRLYKYFKVDFTYYENISDGFIDTLRISDITNQFDLDNNFVDEQQFNFVDFKTKNIIGLFILSKKNAVYFLNEINKYKLLINYNQFFIDNFTSISHSKIFLYFDHEKEKFQVIPHKLLNIKTKEGINLILFFSQAKLHKIMNNYYKFSFDFTINPFEQKMIEQLPKQTYLCSIKNFTHFFKKVSKIANEKDN